MAEIITGEFSKYRSNLLDMHSDMKVWLWDCGPSEPDFPESPKAPQGTDGDPKYDLAKIQFKRTLRAYEEALLRYERDLAEWQDWGKRYGGPIEVLQWSCDARDTLAHDARAVAESRQDEPRWHISARTRGFDKLKNRGLPAGMKPGHGHEAAISRQIAGEQEFDKALRADPVFGQEIAR